MRFLVCAAGALLSLCVGGHFAFSAWSEELCMHFGIFEPLALKQARHPHLRDRRFGSLRVH